MAVATDSNILRVMYETEQFSDVTICCRGGEKKAHKSVLCLQSPFFNAALTGGFREAVDSRIEFPEEEPSTVQGALEYLYIGRYTHIGTSATFSTFNEAQQNHILEEDLKRALDIFLLADKIQVAGLKKYCFDQFDAILHAKPNTSAYATRTPTPHTIVRLCGIAFSDSFADDGSGQKLSGLFREKLLTRVINNLGPYLELESYKSLCEDIPQFAQMVMSQQHLHSWALARRHEQVERKLTEASEQSMERLKAYRQVRELLVELTAGPLKGGSLVFVCENSRCHQSRERKTVANNVNYRLEQLGHWGKDFHDKEMRVICSHCKRVAEIKYIPMQ
ncbi:hypothetical protein BJ508DRAFT_86189 [Ascobolus immersus RN42]|uniref:BTB domain-containing protein n=1 Tax=Ascobolus immersus RN42 TaxID=1160509 RepID=A0A3N4IEK4_ASCIM|nr:hypothetical protein BJ508DRAFT_86189 [Ascobolus immersus RN42]